jgi:hypothetical protein
VDAHKEQFMSDDIEIKLTDENNKPALPDISKSPKVDLSERVKDATTANELLEDIIRMNEDDFIPWEEYQLPSRGVYYGDKLPEGIVRVRGMGIHADKILATQRLAQTGQSIDYLFRHCVQLTDEMDPGELLSGDRIFLLYLLRGITHGNIYEFMLKCQSCDASSMQVYDLNELASTVTGPNLDLGQEPFKVGLPYMSSVLKRSVWVKVRLTRGNDTSTIANRQKFNRRAHSGVPKRDKRIIIDQAITENLALIITSFGGEGVEGEVTDSVKIKELVDRMHSKDTAEIREFLRANSPGIDTTIQVSCPECGAEFKAELPITETFFRPARTGESG